MQPGGGGRGQTHKTDRLVEQIPPPQSSVQSRVYFGEFTELHMDSSVKVYNISFIIKLPWPVPSNLEMYSNYHSLQKKSLWAEHFTSLPKRGVGALSTVSAFNHKRVPTSCLQWFEALEAKIGHKIMYNGITSGFKVESLWHITLWTARCDREHSVVRSAHCISYVLLRKDALY